MLKAYNTYAGESAYDSGCLLVFAENASKAKAISYKFFDNDYISMKANRVKRLDYLANIKDGNPWCAEFNDDLPDGVKFYIEDEI